MAATKAATSKNGAAPAAPRITIQRIGLEQINVPIVGTSPLIVHAFSAKAKLAMLNAMQGKKIVKEPKDPEVEYQAAFYRLEDGTPAMPAGAFCKATVGGARFYASVKMTELKAFLRFVGEIGGDGRMMVPITGEPYMREDVAKVNRGLGTDLRYRPCFPEWSTTLQVIYPPPLLSRDSVLSLIDAGGMGVGVGDWRPEKGGEFGTYQINTDREIEVIQ